MSNTVRILFIGDVVGATGRAVVQKHVAKLKQHYAIDAVIINGENSATNGRGITARIVKFFKHVGADVVTTGNHVWFQREVYAYLDQDHSVLRPANFPTGVPGVGVTTFECNGTTIGVVNLQGRVFMKEYVDCPFRAIDSILTYLRYKTKVVIIDFHAEATAEKIGFAWYVDGRVSGVFGTHTHVQTADDRILPGGTAFITDAGMVGSLHSMIGMKKDPIITSMVTQLPARFMVETSPPYILCGVWVDIDTQTGKALAIERIWLKDDEPLIQHDENSE